MSQLFSPLKIREVQFRNRIVMSPMCQYSADDGFATDWHLVHLGSRAVGGAGLIIQEATAVSAEGRISYGDLGIWKDEHIDKLKSIVSFINSQGAVAGIQLAHAGRKASSELPWNGGRQIKDGVNSWQSSAPSPIPFHPSDNAPQQLSIDQIQQVIEDFRQATRRAVAAGYQVVEIHAAHGYLIHEFLSPLSNQRTDEYGGSFENRTRLLLEIVDVIKKQWKPGFPIFVRISATDYADGGWDIEQSVNLASVLKSKAVDLIDCSSGGLIPGVTIPLGPGYQVAFAERIRNETGILVGAVGLITTGPQAEHILDMGQADLVIMARELIRDPYFPLHAAAAHVENIKWPNQYLRASPGFK